MNQQITYTTKNEFKNMLIARQRIHTCHHQEIFVSSCVCRIISSFLVISKLAAVQTERSRGVRICSFQRTSQKLCQTRKASSGAPPGPHVASSLLFFFSNLIYVTKELRFFFFFFFPFLALVKENQRQRRRGSKQTVRAKSFCVISILLFCVFVLFSCPDQQHHTP